MQDFWIHQGLVHKGFLLAACLLCFLMHPSTQVISNISLRSIPEVPSEGQSVTLTVTSRIKNVKEFRWYRGSERDEARKIFKYLPGQYNPQRNGPQFSNREVGFENGSLWIQEVTQSDAGPYTLLLLFQPNGSMTGTIDFRLAGSPKESKPPVDTSGTLGWIVSGIVVGVLLAAALGAGLVYRFVLHKAEPGSGMAGRQDPGGEKAPASKHDDKGPIYEVMELPIDVPRMEGKLPPPIPGIAVPLPPLPGTSPRLDSNYMELLCRPESIYSEIKR